MIPFIAEAHPQPGCRINQAVPNLQPLVDLARVGPWKFVMEWFLVVGFSAQNVHGSWIPEPAVDPSIRREQLDLQNLQVDPSV